MRKAKKRLITQREAAGELELNVRRVKRLLYALRKHGDKAVVHWLPGRWSNQRIEEAVEKTAVKILSADVYQGFGPTLARHATPRAGTAASTTGWKGGARSCT